MNEEGKTASARAAITPIKDGRKDGYKTGKNGRDEKGHFIKGNTVAKGTHNYALSKRAELWHALLKTVNKQEVEALVRGLIRKAKKGDVQAAKEILDRIFGKPHQTVETKNEAPPTVLIQIVGGEKEPKVVVNQPKDE